MLQNSATATISRDCLISILGTEISTADFTQIQDRIQLLTIDPGSTFWYADNDQPGIYIIVAGKVRLFNLANKRVATLIVGQSFGASTLFPAADLHHYIAKSPLVVSDKNLLIGFIPCDAIDALWSKYPAIQDYLSQTAQQFDRIVSGEIAVAPTSASSRFQPQQLSDSRIPPVTVTNLTIRAPAVAVPPPPAPNQQQLSEAYFPTPSQKMGQWWQKVTHNYPFYAQQGAADCGAACIVMVGRYWGREFNINRLRELAYVNRDGASLKGDRKSVV